MTTVKKAKSKAVTKKAVKKATPEVQPQVEEQPALIDIIIDVSITMLDGSVHSKKMAIENATGCIMKSDLNNPNMVFEMFKLGLMSKYGSGHIKG